MTIGRVVDVSIAQHGDLPPGQGPAINWKAAAQAGVTTALIKATQGTTYLNPWFHTDVAGAQAAGLDVLAYHYCDFSGAPAEAEWFLANAGHLARIGDFETSTNVAWMRTFLQALGGPPSELLGYGSASSFRSVYQQLPAMAWVAAYGQLYPGWGVLWQFTDAATIPGIPGAVDESRWYGSVIAYETLFGQPPPLTGGAKMLAPTPTGNGYWTVDAAGAVYARGDAEYLGGPNTSNTAPAGQPAKWDGPPNLIPGRVVVSIASHPVTQGYWIEDNYGDVFAYGAAPYLGAGNT